MKSWPKPNGKMQLVNLIFLINYNCPTGTEKGKKLVGEWGYILECSMTGFINRLSDSKRLVNKF